MSDFIDDYTLQMHTVVKARRVAGRPGWDGTIELADVFRDEATTFEERRDEIVKRIQESEWMDRAKAGGDRVLPGLLADVAKAEDVGTFDREFHYIYLLADRADEYGRWWLSTS